MTNSTSIQWLVITDLDGTLLNHHSYAVDKALPALKRLEEENIPVIFNTSKTAAESITLQNELNIQAPFIVENGSAIYLPKSLITDMPEKAESFDQYWVVMLGQNQQTIRQILKQLDTNDNSYQLLSDCTVQQAIDLTGLTEEQAQQAISREYSEPLIWRSNDEALAIFKQQLAEHNLHTLQGGRFLHVLGNTDKGKASRSLKPYFGSPLNTVKTIILGDSANDAAMLEMADISVIVNSPSNHTLEKLIKPTIKTDNQAPQGWAEGIEKALIKIEQNEV